ncbi:hypothetical protein Trydic_g2596 [Trypoxylus dichotomus]
MSNTRIKGLPSLHFTADNLGNNLTRNILRILSSTATVPCDSSGDVRWGKKSIFILFSLPYNASGVGQAVGHLLIRHYLTTTAKQIRRGSALSRFDNTIVNTDSRDKWDEIRAVTLPIVTHEIDKSPLA